LSWPEQEQRQQLVDSTYSRLVVIEDNKQDEPLGIVQKKALLAALLCGQPFSIRAHLEKPAAVLETQTAIETLEVFRFERKQLAFVVDEFGTLEGIVTPTDVLEEIAGDLPEAGEHHIAPVQALRDDQFEVDAGEN